MNVSVRQSRLAMQGIVMDDPGTLAELDFWFRFTPALCAVLAAVATALDSAPLTILLAVTALLGALFPHHPFDLVYNVGVRRLTRTAPLPPNRMPRRFACGVATVWLAGTAWAFAAGFLVTGRVLGAMFVVIALIPALTHFCVPSFLFHLMTRRSATRTAGAES